MGAWANGSQDSLDRITRLVYEDLRRLAAAYLRHERPDHTLQPTALVHEAYLRLVNQQNPSWQNRSHFFGVAAHLMRQILLDYARRQAGKRAGRKAVELRYFAGLSMEETAQALDVSHRTVRRDLRMAETWLYHEMRSE